MNEQYFKSGSQALTGEDILKKVNRVDCESLKSKVQTILVDRLERSKITPQLVNSVISAHYFTEIMAKDGQSDQTSLSLEKAIAEGVDAIIEPTLPYRVVALNNRKTIIIPITDSTKRTKDFLFNTYTNLQSFIESTDLNVDVQLAEFKSEKTSSRLNFLTSSVVIKSIADLIIEKLDSEVDCHEKESVFKVHSDNDTLDLIKKLESDTKNLSIELHSSLAKYLKIRSKFSIYFREFLATTPEPMIEILVERRLVSSDLIILNEFDLYDSCVGIKTLLNELQMAHEREGVPFVFEKYLKTPKSTDAEKLAKNIIAKYGA